MIKRRRYGAEMKERKRIRSKLVVQCSLACEVQTMMFRFSSAVIIPPTK